MIGVFVDTFIVLTLNALVIISTLYTKDGILHDGVIPETIGKANLAQTAFGTVFGERFGPIFVAVCLFFFAFSTILSWNLFGKKSLIVYSVVSLIFIFLGTMASNDLVWELSDMFNQLMVLPNALAMFALTSLVVGMMPKVQAKAKTQEAPEVEVKANVATETAAEAMPEATETATETE